MRVCEWCGVRFLAWGYSDQKFCKPVHAKRASEKRRKARVKAEKEGRASD